MPKVLVIDDSGFMRQFVRGLLEDAGHEVEDFLPLSALEVLKKCQVFLPDLVVTDYNMPHVDGQAVIRMLRRHSTTLPVVLLTATRDPERMAKLKAYNPLWVLYKPITGENLMQELAGILAQQTPGPGPS